MKGLKLLMISAEISALICIGIVLFKCASEGKLYFIQAAIIAVFVVAAVLAQSFQQDISDNNDVTK